MPKNFGRTPQAPVRDIIPDDANLWSKPQVAAVIGVVADEIVRRAHDYQADLIVMGVHCADAVAITCCGRLCMQSSTLLVARC
jgi:nucleotide-binding universal stress UspA family protein